MVVVVIKIIVNYHLEIRPAHLEPSMKSLFPKQSSAAWGNSVTTHTHLLLFSCSAPQKLYSLEWISLKISVCITRRIPLVRLKRSRWLSIGSKMGDENEWWTIKSCNARELLSEGLLRIWSCRKKVKTTADPISCPRQIVPDSAKTYKWTPTFSSRLAGRKTTSEKHCQIHEKLARSSTAAAD